MPIDELIAQYEEEECDHSDMTWVVAAARRYVSTMKDSQVRCLLHVLAEHVASSLSLEDNDEAEWLAMRETDNSLEYAVWKQGRPHD